MSEVIKVGVLVKGRKTDVPHDFQRMAIQVASTEMLVIYVDDKVVYNSTRELKEAEP